MRRILVPSRILLVSVAVLSGSQQPVAAQAEPSNSTIRLAPSPRTMAAQEGLPASRAAAPRNSQTTLEQLPNASRGTSVPTTATRANGIQQVGYVEPQAPRPGVDVPNYNRSRSLAGVYPSASAQATLNKLPRPAPVQSAVAAPAPQASRQRGKPFQSIQTDPALSPYLNLYRTNLNPNTMPNYFALVRPQFDQQEMNRKQAAEIQKLQMQLQSSQAAGGPAMGASNGRMSASARYMETGQFYKHSRR